MSRKLIIAAQRWIGTPFHARASVCGHGVDCVQLAAALLSEGGFGDHALPKEYDVDFGDHADKSPLLWWFVNAEWLGVTDMSDTLPGDVVLFRVGRVANHCGVIIGDRQFCHCLRGHGVMLSRLDDPTYSRRIVMAFRPPGGGA